MFLFEDFVFRFHFFVVFISLLFSRGFALHKINSPYNFIVVIIVIIVNIIIKYQITTWFVLVILLIAVYFIFIRFIVYAQQISIQRYSWRFIAVEHCWEPDHWSMCPIRHCCYYYYYYFTKHNSVSSLFVASLCNSVVIACDAHTISWISLY